MLMRRFGPVPAPTTGPTSMSTKAATQSLLLHSPRVYHNTTATRRHARITPRAEEASSTSPASDTAASSSNSSFATLRDLMKRSRTAGPEPELVLSRAPVPPPLFEVVQPGLRSASTTAPSSPAVTAASNGTAATTRAAPLVRSRGVMMSPWLPPSLTATHEVTVSNGSLAEEKADLDLVTGLVTQRALAALHAEHPQDFRSEETLATLQQIATLTYTAYSQLFEVRALMPPPLQELFPSNLLQLTEMPGSVRIERDCSPDEVHGEILRHLFDGLNLPRDALKQVDFMLNSFLGDVMKSVSVTSTHLDTHLLLVTKYIQEARDPAAPPLLMLRISWFTLTSDTWQLVVGGGKNQHTVTRVKFTLEYHNTLSKLNRDLVNAMRPQLQDEMRRLLETTLEMNVPSVEFKLP